MRGRFAPSPTGYLHLGNVWTALLCWLQVRQAAGTLVLRIEDIDEQRSKKIFREALLEDLSWLGLQWDEGPDVGGPCRPYIQQQRYGCYEEALDQLRQQHLLYPCYCSRSRLQAVGAPHAGELSVYDGHCYHLTDSQRQAIHKVPSWRVHVPRETIVFTDGICGMQQACLSADCGDFVVRRADGMYAYQLAVSVDDGAMGITHVLRGRDLLSSTARQIWLLRLFGYVPPAYFHVPMLVDPAGNRLSKRQHGITVRQLRTQGVTAEAILSYLAWCGRLVSERRVYTLSELVDTCDLTRLGAADIVVHDDISRAIGDFLPH
ncbi:MAG: tRNA glutamyl-Q(34) synthetase GluQRS [Megasphaera sp.]|nr:tRNA glutamyl-Q(34) synthetase GluQRS [Megasphaera sp.]MCI1247942.1 tRNA glutamyl-Q(34) synthetase GluQRS [Megasphaera sp.]